MPEKVNIVYGQIDDNKQGIVEFRFDADTWIYKKEKSIIKIRRKEAKEEGDIVKVTQ